MFKKRIIITDKVIISVILKTLGETFISAYNLIASLFGGGLVIFIFWFSYFDYDLLPSFLIGVTVYFLIFGLLFNIKAIKNFSKAYHKADEFNIYGDTIKKLGSAFSIVHELERSNNEEFDYVMQMLESFCTIIQDIFKHLTDNVCSVSIKIHVEEPTGNNTDPRVITLARDLETTKSGERENRNSLTKHYISKNSCYQHFYVNLGKERGRYYLNNNIVEDHLYKNTSFDYYGSKPTSTDPETRHKEWPLPYKSELVVPIKLKEQSDNSSLIGFVCIDCEDVNVINHKYDSAMTIGIAEGLYNVLNKYKIKGTLN